MKFASMIGIVALAAGAACAQSTTAGYVVAPCTASDSVSGTPVPCYGRADSVSGTPALSVTLTAAGQTLPFSSVAARCRDAATRKDVGCRLSISTGAPLPAPMVNRADSVSGTPVR